MVQRGAEVFPQSVFPILDTVRQLSSAKYNADGIEEVMASLVGDRKLAN